MRNTPPERVWSHSFPDAAAMDRLLTELYKRGYSKEWTVLHELASMSPEVRLAVNLKRVLALNIKHPVDNILVDGLTNEERSVLSRLDSVLPQDLREIAHGLLNVHERWVVARAMAKYFRQAKAVRDGQLLPKPLDNILGG